MYFLNIDTIYLEFKSFKNLKEAIMNQYYNNKQIMIQAKNLFSAFEVKEIKMNLLLEFLNSSRVCIFQ